MGCLRQINLKEEIGSNYMENRNIAISHGSTVGKPMRKMKYGDVFFSEIENLRWQMDP